MVLPGFFSLDLKFSDFLILRINEDESLNMKFIATKKYQLIVSSFKVRLIGAKCMFSIFRTHAVLFGQSIVILESIGPPGRPGLVVHERSQPGPQ